MQQTDVKKDEKENWGEKNNRNRKYLAGGK